MPSLKGSEQQPAGSSSLLQALGAWSATRNRCRSLTSELKLENTVDGIFLRDRIYDRNSKSYGSIAYKYYGSKVHIYI